MNRVLLAEDDERLALLVQDYLEANGFQVTIEGQGQRVTRSVSDLMPDIVILDIMLPGKDGLTICQEIRPKYQGPILMLTARDSDMDQVLGLEFGADEAPMPGSFSSKAADSGNFPPCSATRTSAHFFRLRARE